MKVFAKVPYEYQQDGIRWLIIEPIFSSDGVPNGYLLLQRDVLEDPSIEWDTWFPEQHWAYEAAEEDYGIKEADWLSLND